MNFFIIFSHFAHENKKIRGNHTFWCFGAQIWNFPKISKIAPNPCVCGLPVLHNVVGEFRDKFVSSQPPGIRPRPASPAKSLVFDDFDDFGTSSNGGNSSKNQEKMKIGNMIPDMFQNTLRTDSVPIFMPSGPLVTNASRCDRSRNAYSRRLKPCRGRRQTGQEPKKVIRLQVVAKILISEDLKNHSLFFYFSPIP